MNSFTQYWSGRVPAAVFLAAYPLGLRQPHEWEVFYYGLGGLEMTREIYARFGMYYLGPVRHGANIIHSKKPIRSIEDLKGRSEENTSELQSLMRISYAVFCLQQKTTNTL